MISLRKRVLAAMASVCMIAGSMAAMSFTASAESIGNVQQMKAYWIKNNATGLYLTLDNMNINDYDNTVTVQELNPTNTKQQFYINKDTSYPSGSGYGYYTLSSVYSQGFCVSGEKSAVTSTGRVFASSSTSTRWYIADKYDGSVTISFDNYQQDKMVANDDFGTDARKVWLAGYMAGGNSDWTIEPVEDRPAPAPTFKTGICYVRNAAGDYLGYAGKAAAGTNVGAFGFKTAWDIELINGEYYLSVPGTSLYMSTDAGQVVLGSRPSRGFTTSIFDESHFILMLQMQSADDTEKYLQADADGNVVIASSVSDYSRFAWESIKA